MTTTETPGVVALRLAAPGRALLSPQEASEALGVGTSTLYKLMQSGELPFSHVVGRTKIAASDVAAFIDRKRNEKPAMRRTPWSGDPDALKKRVATRAARRTPSQNAERGERR